MKSTTLALLPLLLVAQAQLHAGQRLIPAGSLVQCTVSEPKLSSKTEAVGDPVLCQVGASGAARAFGSALLPYDTYLSGRFEDYRDPGHLVGKGWMLLSFDRLVIEPETVLPINAKLVGVHGYNVDREGRIRGKGHAGRDVFEWTLPILWPIDVLDLPRRGPRPTLKSETRLTLKIMDDIAVPTGTSLQQDPSGLYRRAPSSYTPPTPDENLQRRSIAPNYGMQPEPNRAQAEPRLMPAVAVKRTPFVGGDSQNVATVIFKDGRPAEPVRNFVLTPTTLYVLDMSGRRIIPLSEVDMAATREANRRAGIDFHVPAAAQ